MAKCIKVILLYDDNTTRVYDPDKIDSIFFDKEKARCFAKNCLGDSDVPGGGSSADNLDAALRRAGDTSKDAGGGGGAPGDPSQEGGQTATALATAPNVVAADNGFECIHMVDCTWDCGGNGN